MKRIVDYTLESFARIFKFDLDPTLTEEENVRLIINQTALVSAALTWIQPIPMADFMLLTPLHAKMTVHIGKAKGFELSDERALEIFQELVAAMGIAYVANQVIIGVSKFIPIVFGIALFPLFYSSTWAMGKVIEYYFDCRKRNHVPDANDLRRVYKKALVTGKVLASKLNMEDIKAKAAEIKRQFSGHKEPEPKRPTAANNAPRHQSAPSQKSPIHISARPKSRPTSPVVNKASAPKKTDEPGQVAPGIDPIEALEELGQKWKAKSISKADYQAERKRLLKLL
ncbi:MAG: hypothetical protein P1V97_24725 [Planctomycetota bacterium]|nr:hypothetical protein [Planctomycetota bacterium]